MKSFLFDGILPSSKSLYLRALIIKSYNKDILISGVSESKDIDELIEALKNLSQGKSNFFISEGAAPFRFLCLRLSREKGDFNIKIGEKLRNRPHDELKHILSQLNVKISFDNDFVHINSNGWVLNNDESKIITVSSNISSQFLSSLVLNCWNVTSNLIIKVNGDKVSWAYFKMSLDLLSKFGLNFSLNKNTLFIQANQKPLDLQYSVEADLSTMSVLILLSLLNDRGKFILRNFPLSSVQPDYFLLEILKKLGVNYSSSESMLKIPTHYMENLKPIDISLKNSPDLFPVLSIFLCFIEGKSVLRDCDVNIYKESNRIKEVSHLIDQMGINYEYIKGEFTVYGKLKPNLNKIIEIDTSSDHRIAMACSILMLMGYTVEMKGKESVNKSFRSFWEVFYKGIA